MEACHVKRGQGSCISIPQIPVGKLAYQNFSRDQLSPRGGLELHRPQWLSHTSKISHTICGGGFGPIRRTNFGSPHCNVCYLPPRGKAFTAAKSMHAIRTPSTM